MPETSERDIEKQLREHAEKRRAAAGDPLLHPATRRVLQTEVRRHWGGRNADPTGESWLQRFWPRLAFALGVVAVLGTMAVIMLGPGGRPPMNFAKLEDNAPRPGAQPLPAPASAPMVADNAPTSLDDDNSRRPQVDSNVSTEAQLASRASGFAAAATIPPAAQEFSANETLAAKKLAPVAESQFFEGTLLAKNDEAYSSDKRRDRVEATDGVTFTGATGGRLQFAALLQADKQALGVTQVFRNVAIPAGEKTKPTGVLPVLGNFTVAQNGNELTVTDEDGSVYNGTAELAPPEIVAGQTVSSGASLTATPSAARMAAKDEMPRRSEPKPVPAESNILTVGVNASQAQAIAVGESLNWQFKVEGTNRSLRQRVVFTGNLFQNTVNSQAVEPGRQAYQQVPTAQNQLRNYNQGQLVPQNNFINGRVVLDNRRETELNALSVDPK